MQSGGVPLGTIPPGGAKFTRDGDGFLGGAGLGFPLLPPMPPGRVALWVLMAAVGGVYLAFQKKALPLRYARVAGKLFFWPTMPLTIMNRWGNYWTPVDKTVVLGAAPLGMLGHVDRLRDMRVTGVINLCDEYAGPTEMYQKYGIKQLRLPVVDHTEPSLSDLKRAVAFIEEKQAKGERVLVHCKAGHGRSAAVALCWLIKRNPGVATHVLNQQLAARRKVRKTLYAQKSVKAFAKEVVGTAAGS